jgi:hypothetical protein
MPALIKKKELQLLVSLLLTRKYARYEAFQEEILSAHGCSMETHSITSDGWIIPKPT